MQSEIPPQVPLKLKVEINTREHFDVFGIIEKRFEVKSPWFNGEAQVKTYITEELSGTKLRALYQRRKGRDLFDLWVVLGMKSVQPAKIVEAFHRYMKEGKTSVTKKEFKKNLEVKMKTEAFHNDLKPLLNRSVVYDPAKAAEVVTEKLLNIL
jgi:predicted nucleotidyltransferase component of viral defense system